MGKENSLQSRGKDENALKGIMFTGTAIMSEKVYFYRIKNFMNFLEKKMENKQQ